jgi:hypothetical protein
MFVILCRFIQGEINRMYIVSLIVHVENGCGVKMRKNVFSASKREQEFTSYCGHIMEVHFTMKLHCVCFCWNLILGYLPADNTEIKHI